MKKCMGALTVVSLVLVTMASCVKQADKSHIALSKNTSRIGDGNLGVIHNDVMAYANNNLNLIDDANATTIYNSVESITDDYLDNNYPEWYNSEYTADFKTWCNREIIFDELENIDATWNSLISNGVINTQERDFLDNIRDAAIDLKDGTITLSQYQTTLANIKNNIDGVSSAYEYANGAIDIAIASADYWENYWVSNPPETPINSDLANFVGQDAAGALVGGAIGAAREYASTGDVTLGNLGTSMLIGAASASLGIVGKVAKGLKSFFGW